MTNKGTTTLTITKIYVDGIQLSGFRLSIEYLLPVGKRWGELHNHRSVSPKPKRGRNGVHQHRR